MKWYVLIGNGLLILFFILFLSFAAFMGIANAEGRMYKLTEKDKIYTACRLSKRKVVKDQMICIYIGANGTNETIFNEKYEACPRTIQCIYEPNKSLPSIDEMMNSLEKSLKGR